MAAFVWSLSDSSSATLCLCLQGHPGRDIVLLPCIGVGSDSNFRFSVFCVQGRPGRDIVLSPRAPPVACLVLACMGKFHNHRLTNESDSVQVEIIRVGMGGGHESEWMAGNRMLMGGSD